MPDSEHKTQRPGILRDSSQEGSHRTASPSSYLRVADTQSGQATPKSVSIAKQSEVISPLVLGSEKNVDDFHLDYSPSPKRLPVKSLASKRLTGRPPSTTSVSQRSDAGLESTDENESNHHHGHLHDLVDQVSEWIKLERSKHHERKAKRGATNSELDPIGDGTTAVRHYPDAGDDLDLDKLEEIIKHNLRLERRSRRGSHSLRNRLSLRRLRKQSGASSDNDYFESDGAVPSCDVTLDNSRTLTHAEGASSESEDSGSGELRRTASYKDRDAWSKFKFDIVRLSHTLRLKGWRRVPMSMCTEITVERLSGALTNAVYVVSPPETLSARNEKGEQAAHEQPKRPPPKLLLRIYGPQVEHLIDRDAELAILGRLARKKIGPRLLGTFKNGRFEEYLYAKPLTPQDLRNPDTSRQIAKRMRELHDGIELLDRERGEGAFVWQNWDKWVDRVEKVVSWLDCQVKRMQPDAKPTGAETWKRRGYICGTPWKQFREMVEKYRMWLNAQYDGQSGVREQLVFAHNDTQYGNILRLMPSGESPLLLPANTHKQLIVIDFEYANANLPGLEFANHFTEWCYDYHDERKPYAFHPNWYPTPQEQDRFVRAYVRHRPQFNVSTPKLAPTTESEYAADPRESLSRKSTSSISTFMLDARTPSISSTRDANGREASDSQESEDVKLLIHETRIWRLANTAQWVAWGLVQAKVPGMPKFSPHTTPRSGRSSEESSISETLDQMLEESKDTATQQQGQGSLYDSMNGSEQEDVDEEFDYLGYAQHRAMFFWADAIQFGLAKVEDLPEELLEKVKRVPY